VTGKKYQGNIDEALGLKPIAAKSQQGSLAVCHLHFAQPDRRQYLPSGGQSYVLLNCPPAKHYHHYYLDKRRRHFRPFSLGHFAFLPF
jgi:hypothetical protein